MKFVKLSVLALSLGLFVASCGNKTEGEATPATDSSAMAPATEAAAPAPAAAPDSMNAGPAKDSAAAAAPAAAPAKEEPKH